MSKSASLIGRSQAAVDAFWTTGEWRRTNPFQARPWTDDYTNLAGSFLKNLKTKWGL